MLSQMASTNTQSNESLYKDEKSEKQNNSENVANDEDWFGGSLPQDYKSTFTFEQKFKDVELRFIESKTLKKPTIKVMDISNNGTDNLFAFKSIHL